MSAIRIGSGFHCLQAEFSARRPISRKLFTTKIRFGKSPTDSLSIGSRVVSGRTVAQNI